MNAGKLRKRIQVQANTPTATDAAGAPVPAWATWATVWAAIRASGGYERYISDEVCAASQAIIEMRYLSGLQPWHRFQYADPATGTRIFDIVQIVDVDERHITHIVACTEAVGAALNPVTTIAPTTPAPTSLAPSTAAG